MDGIIIFIVLAALGGYCIGCGLTLRKTQAEVERITDNFYKAQAEAAMAQDHAAGWKGRYRVLQDVHGIVTRQRDERIAVLERRVAELEARPC